MSARKSAKARRRPRLLAAGVVVLFVQSSVQAADGPPEAVLGRDLAASCGACHGTAGRSIAGFPVLAGIERETLIERFKGFRSGERPASVMHQHAKGYSDREIGLLADYFSKQPRGGR
jgi:cytochrome c553